MSPPKFLPLVVIAIAPGFAGCRGDSRRPNFVVILACKGSACRAAEDAPVPTGPGEAK